VTLLHDVHTTKTIGGAVCTLTYGAIYSTVVVVKSIFTNIMYKQQQGYNAYLERKPDL